MHVHVHVHTMKMLIMSTLHVHFVHVVYQNYICSSPRNENFNLLVQIKALNLFLLQFAILKKKFTGPNKGLLVLGRSTGPVLIMRTANMINIKDRIPFFSILDLIQTVIHLIFMNQKLICQLYNVSIIKESQ